MNLNKVFILGRLTADPQVRQTASGISVSSFGLATNRTWTDKAGAKQEETEFHNVVAWGRQAEIIHQFMTKGSLLLVEGRLQTRSWQDKQGQTRKTTEVVAERIQLGPRPYGSGAPQGGAGQAQGGAKFSGGPSAGGVSQHQAAAEKAIAEELPTINMDEPGAEEIKPEDLPF